MDQLKTAALLVSGALVAQYGVRGVGTGRAHASSAAIAPPPSSSTTMLRAARPAASAAPPSPSAVTTSAPTPTTTGPSLASLTAAALRDVWPYAQTAATLAAVGACAAAAHAAAHLLLQSLSRSLIFEAEVDSRDDAYRWLMLWLSRHRALRDVSRVSVTTSLRAFGVSAGDEGVPAENDEGDDEGEGDDGSADGNDDPNANANASSLLLRPPPPGHAPFALLPAPGTHLLWHEGRLFVVSRRRTPGNPSSPSNARLLSETLVLRTARHGRTGGGGGGGTASSGRRRGGGGGEGKGKSDSSGGRAAVLALVAAARSAYVRHTRGSTLVHAVDASGGYWEPACARPRRPLASVVLPSPGDGAALLADARRFLASGSWYASRGIPHRRGYLLHGPPGSGKSSLVAALAAELGLDIYAATLSSPALTDDGLRALLNAAGSGGLLLLEDVDAAFGSRAAGQAGGGGGGGGGGGNNNNSNNGGGNPNSLLTLAGLLNALDGVAAQEGRLLFLTTNHPERLDPALVRPGRVDVRVPFARASRSQLRRMFLRFYYSGGGGGSGGAEAGEEEGSDGRAALAARFAAALPEGQLSLAAVQGLLLLHRDDPEAAVAAAVRGDLKG